MPTAQRRPWHCATAWTIVRMSALSSTTSALNERAGELDAADGVVALVVVVVVVVVLVLDAGAAAAAPQCGHVAWPFANVFWQASHCTPSDAIWTTRRMSSPVVRPVWSLLRASCVSVLKPSVRA